MSGNHTGCAYCSYAFDEAYPWYSIDCGNGKGFWYYCGRKCMGADAKKRRRQTLVKQILDREARKGKREEHTGGAAPRPTQSRPRHTRAEGN